MVKVYYESDIHAELVAIFKDERIYDLCFPVIEKASKSVKMKITESMDDISLKVLICTE